MIPITEDEKQYPLRYLTHAWQAFTKGQPVDPALPLRIEVGSDLYEAVWTEVERMRRLADPPNSPEKALTFKNSTLHKTGKGWSVAFIRPTE